MTTMAPNSEITLFVTHVEADGPFLKIWGQVERMAATRVERTILTLSEQFTQGRGAPNLNSIIPLNTICCARFQSDGYYRAKICEIRRNGEVVVQFIDYGNVEVLPMSAIRLLDNIPMASSLPLHPPLAYDFILANVLSANGTWDSNTIDSIKQSLHYVELKGFMHSVIGGYKLLKLWYNNRDFGELLVGEALAISVSIQEMFAAKNMQQVPLARPAGASYSPLPAVQHNTPRPVATTNSYLSRNSPVINHSPHQTLQQSNIMQEDWRSMVQRRPQTHFPEALVFKSRVLDIASRHDVYVSYVEDGPMKFAVQVKSTAPILAQLMSEINNYPTAPLQEPPLPGSVCLGRYTVDKVLCRAVVMAVMEQKCKLYYVDFGHTEVLPYTDIFQLPPQYINPKVLSIRFTLAGLKEIEVTDALKDYFKKLVTGKALVLQVKPPEGPPLIQYGDLYHNNTNIMDLLKEASQASESISFQEPMCVKKGCKEVVHVSFVESCTKFFVQLDVSIKSLQSVMACLAEYAKTAPQLDKSSLKIGSPCCALYAVDEQWYRAQILQISNTQVTVMYVDYGNEETVSLTALRQIHRDLVKNLRPQAMKCLLNGFQLAAFNQELANQFEMLVLEKELMMDVQDVQPNELVVDLIDTKSIPPISISAQLRSMNTPASSLNNSHANLDHSKSSSKGHESTDSSDDRSHKGKRNKEDTWNQESKSANTWGRDNRKQQERNVYEDKAQFRDKLRSKNVKDVENEQKQRNPWDDSEDRFQRKENRNNYFNKNENVGRYERNENANRYDRNDISSRLDRNDRGTRGAMRRGRSDRFSPNGNSRDENRFDKSGGKDDSWSDKDSDTSSRSSGRRGAKGTRGMKGRSDRPGRRGGDKKNTMGKWSDGDSDKGSYKGSNQSSGYKTRNADSSASSWKTTKNSSDKSSMWNSMSPSSPVKSAPKGRSLEIPPPNITIGAVKNCELIFINSPSDFYVQLCPDNLQLDTIMEQIASTYETGGTLVNQSSIRSGTYCVAQYSCDFKWYRATIKERNANDATVHFIDYGNEESVTYDKIKELKPEFAKLSTQAIHCKLLAVTKSDWSNEEINQFARSTEGITLEAEFVSRDTNSVFEILLKIVTPNASDAVYINQEFSSGTDLMEAKQAARNQGRKTRGRNRETLQVIPADQKWNRQTFQPNSQIDVVVTWFINPNNFYCQVLSKQTEFRRMMNDIQDFYVNQRPISEPLQVGRPVIAFFSDDGALYRAEIRELNKQRGHVVRYVDFGNCAMVDPSKIYPVDQRFAVLSEQAMHCTLKNLAPTRGTDWASANKHQVDKYFDADKYTCTFHGMQDEKYLISLSNYGKDVAETMIAAKLALNPEFIPEPVTSQTTTFNGVGDNADENPDLTLWSGQSLQSTVSKVQSVDHFYIRPVSSTAREISCHLLNVSPTPELNKKLKESVEGKDVIVQVHDTDGSRLAVQLYDLSGSKVKLEDGESDGSISPICPLPVLNTKQKVWVSHINSSDSVWLQRSIDTDPIAELLSALFEYYSSQGTTTSAEVGKLCAVNSSDGNWYRAIIGHVEETNVTVTFIDYGNSEVVASDSIKELAKDFYSPHCLAMETSLSVSLKGSNDEQKSVLENYLNEKEFEATFYNVDKKWLVELSTENETEKLSEMLSKLDIFDGVKETKSACRELPDMVVGNKYEVFVSHCDSPAQFWLQRAEEVDLIETLQVELQAAASDFPPVVGVPENETLCAALYSADGMWYRAEVLDADEEITTVRFIDYGNTDTIINGEPHGIKELPQRWKVTKKFALKSRLDLVPSGSEDWSEVSCERFKTMATSTDSPIVALVIADSIPRRVELFVGEESIGDTLANEGHAIMVHNAEDLIDEIIDLELDPRSAFVSHINSPGEFWVQEEKSVSDLEVMTDRFIVAEMFPKLENVTEEVLCVAKFPDDENWYRARVKSVSDAGIDVLYIDYGNSAISTEVRAIPEDLATIPPLSRKCSLAMPSRCSEWSEKACDKFVELAADGATIFLLDVVQEADTSIVNLTLDGVNVADELTRIDDTLPVIDERLPPLGEENCPNIVVSHVVSPSEFWAQAESSISELELMESRLVNAHSLLHLDTFDEGTICAAKFPEDEKWYRAKILSHSDAGTNVLYFDYGNSALTTELRILPEDVANIPNLAKRCRLQLPETVETWSVESCDEFIRLVADGATMFQFEVLDDAEPSLVSLRFEGNDVSEILSSLCKSAKTIPEDSNEIPEIESDNILNSTEIEQTEISDEVSRTPQETIITEIKQETNSDAEKTTPTSDSNEVVGEQPVMAIKTEIDLEEPAGPATDRSENQLDVVEPTDCSETTKLIASVPTAASTEEEPEIETKCDLEKAGSSPVPVEDIKTEIDSNEEQEEVEVGMELTIDEIVGSMVKEALTNAVDDDKIEVDVPVPTQVLDDKIEVDIPVPTQALDEGEIIAVKSESDVLSISTQSKSDATGETILDSTSSGFSEQDTSLRVSERRFSIPSEDKVVPGSINKGLDLNMSSDSSTSEAAANDPESKATDSSAAPDTPANDGNEKIVPDRTSRSESPSVELSRPTTPKTPHSEKLVAGVVTLHENILEYDDNDEMLSVEIDNNIPKSSSS